METVDLTHRDMGGEAGQPQMVLLHGMLGSSRNWQTAGRKLAGSCRVLVPDLRNHGGSPHHEEMNYPAMAADMLRWMDRENLGQIHILGHSMGGKVAMYLACHYPERFKSLTVVDISPKAYPPRWEMEFAAMQAMPVGDFISRLEAEEWLEADIRDWAFRKFLVSNLERNPEGGFRWLVNLDTLQASLPNLFIQVPTEGEGYEGPVLFLKGGTSRFIDESDVSMIQSFFPTASLQTITAAGHNVHFDQPGAFVEAVLAHVSKAEK